MHVMTLDKKCFHTFHKQAWVTVIRYICTSDNMYVTGTSHAKTVPSERASWQSA